MNLHALAVTREDIEIELAASIEEGRAVPPELRAEAERLMATDLSWKAAQEQAGKFLDQMHALALRPDYPYREPSDLRHIREERPESPQVPGHSLDREGLLDRLHGAWVGRAAGCLLGKPVEGWHRERLHGYLRDTNAFPLKGYIRGDAPPNVLEKYEVPADRGAFIERVNGLPEDDDLNYTVLSHVVLQKQGDAFTSEDIAEEWLTRLPVLRTFTAERVAYRNLVAGIAPPHSGSYRNPYREWIGAQIRADGWGYVCPGDPETAAALAWRDACISHVKNGIYGAMWSAAMNAAAFSLDSPRAIVEAGLAQIPARCRLADWIRTVMDWHEMGLPYDDACERIHAEWDEKRFHHWCHVISNAAIVTMALLYGEGDFGASVCRAVQAAFDTDCNAATVGSVLGAKLGASRLTEEWTAPLNDTIETGVVGYQRLRLTELARMSLDVIEKQRGGKV